MIPGFQDFILPVLKAVAEEGSITSSDARRVISQRMAFTEAQLNERLPSGTQTVVSNRVAWSLVYLQKSGLLERIKRGVYQITDEGKRVLSEKPERIDIAYLKKFESFREFTSSESVDDDTTHSQVMLADPRTETEAAFVRLKEAVLKDLLDRVALISPEDFELLVLKLMKKMGYGLSDSHAIEHLGGPGDGGVDGVIFMDTLGLEAIYLQAKRYNPESGTIGRPDLQKFVGSLNERKAKKGVFITTGRFAQNAHEYCDRIDLKIVLIDGERLVSLMYEYDLAVQTEAVLKIKKVDLDFFEG